MQTIPNLIKFILILILLCSTISYSQSNIKDFTRIKYNNYGLITDLGVGLWAWPLPVDFDNDGDNDLLVNCSDKPYNGIYYFENVEGNVAMPIFKPAKRIGPAHRNIQISSKNDTVKYLIPGKEIVDISNGITKQIFEKENIHDEEKKIRANQWKYCDYDNDGALDLIISVGDWSDYGWDNAFDKNGNWLNGPLHGFVYLIKNLGTTKNPKYDIPQKILADEKPIDVYGMPSANFADFDNDGDLDIICGEFLDKFTYFQNVGTRENPKYSTGIVLSSENNAIKMDLEMIVPVSIDWDKDGDVDLIVGQEDGRVAFIENLGKLKNGIPQFANPKFFKQEADDIKFGALVTPFSVDWDNDGDEDLICGNT
ncbi:MAG: VCBS repeat-containing protein, partial [Ignavibacteriae bacterium]|nr:VCBS repeat-containing protein [Ignavibacteriota bacterium]